jgi:hypothetical protein
MYFLEQLLYLSSAHLEHGAIAHHVLILEQLLYLSSRVQWFLLFFTF